MTNGPAASPAQGPDSQLEANKAIARAALNALQQGDLKALNKLYEPNGSVHTPSGATQSEHGPHSNLKDASPLLVALNPRQIDIEVMLAEGDLVAVRWTLRGKQSGNYRGVPPTGKELSFAFTNIFRIRNGRIAENWASTNPLPAMEQIGFTLTPPPSAKK